MWGVWGGGGVCKMSGENAGLVSWMLGMGRSLSGRLQFKNVLETLLLLSSSCHVQEYIFNRHRFNFLLVSGSVPVDI